MWVVGRSGQIMNLSYGLAKALLRDGAVMPVDEPEAEPAGLVDEATASDPAEVEVEVEAEKPKPRRTRKPKTEE